MRGGLRRSISVTDPRLLVPVGTAPPGRLNVIDGLELPGVGHSRLLVIAEDDDAGWHLLPLIDERAGLRRAREGDGWATAAAALFAADFTPVAPFVARRRGFDLGPLSDDATELVIESTTEHEVVGLGLEARIRLALRPHAFERPRPSIAEHLSVAGFRGLAGTSCDLVWSGPDRFVSPLVGVGEMLRGQRLDEAFGAAAIDHLRGGTEAEPTLQLVDALALELAGLHVALATPTDVIRQPRAGLTADQAHGLARDVRDSVAEASLIAGADIQEALRSRRGSLRNALAPLAAAEGVAVLPSGPFRSLTQATVLPSGQVRLDPLQMEGGQQARPPVADLAALLRNLDHVAYGSLRRLVGTGESVPVERASSWAHAVRDRLVFRYREHLDEAGAGDLFNEQLLVPFEIEAECIALTFAARHLSTWSTVPQMGLLDLLPTD